MTKVIRFTATWCAPCKVLAPIFNELSQEFGDKATFMTIDIDQNKEMAAEYNISSIPQIIIEKDGKQVSRTVGLKPKPTYIATFNAFL